MKKYTKLISLMLVLIMTLSACNYVSPYGAGTVTERKTAKKENTVSTPAETTAEAQITSEETTAENTGPEETTKELDSKTEIAIIFEDELPKPAKEYTIEDFPEVEDVISYYFEEYDKPKYAAFNIKIPDDTPEEKIEKMIAELEAREDVHLAIWIPPASLCSLTPPPTFDFHYQYGDQWGLYAINIEDAWDITTGSNSVKVGIVDTGIDYTHEDLQGKVHVGLSRSFVTTGTEDQKSPLKDFDGHGTHVAGIIGANASGIDGSSEGIAGINWNVTLISLKISIGKNDFSLDNIIAAIEYADEIGIDILNMSLILTLDDYDAARLNEAIENFDGLIVCGAGNTAGPLEHKNFYPAASDAPNVITVGAMDEDFNKIDVSNYGATKVDLFAPGENIISCQAGVTNGYVYKRGTSMATPHVTGVAALLLSAYPNMDALDVKETIMKRVNKVRGNNPDDPSTYDQYLFEGLCVSKGILDAKEALERPVYHSHQYSSTSVIHRMECVCGDFYIAPHSYTVPTDYGNLTYHKLLCACGRDGGVTQAHTWSLVSTSPLSEELSPDYVAPVYECTGCGAVTTTPSSIS